jgi:predicted secreted Zn-dependent protease
VKFSAAIVAIVLALSALPVLAQGFTTKGKDGSVTYSNRPVDPADTAKAPVAMPSAAEVTQYQLVGATLEDVQKDAAMKSPADPASAHRVWSTTTWSAVWNYWTKQEADACRIDVVSVKLRIATQLPAWNEPKEVAEADDCRWKAFAKSLQKKEDAQVARALARGRELERAILALPPRPSCDTFAAEVQALGQKLVDDGKPRLPPAPPKLAVTKPMPKMPMRPVPPSPPKPLPIPKAIYDACQG